MTEDFRGLRDLLAAGTPTPWDADRLDDGVFHLARYGYANPAVARVPKDTDAALIVAAVNSLPGLLERIDKLETLLREELQWASDNGYDASESRCPTCWRSPTKGHAPDCKLAALLAPAEPGGGDA